MPILSPKAFSALLFTSLLLSWGAAPAAAQRIPSYDHDEVLERRFAARPGGVLTLDTDLGSVRITGTTEDAIVVKVVRGANDVSEREAREAFERFDVAFDETARGLSIEGTYEVPHFWRRNNRLQVHYEIAVPRETGVTVETAGGSIHVAELAGSVRLQTSGGSVSASGIDGTVDVETSGGSVTAERVKGRAKLHSSGGSITARGIGGPLDVNTSGGSIAVADVRGDLVLHTSGGGITLENVYGGVEAHSSGGSIEADIAEQPEGPMRLETSGGSVVVHLPASIRADIRATASGGSVKTDLPVTVEGEVQRDHLQGTLNGGGPLLSLESSGGGVQIRRR